MSGAVGRLCAGPLRITDAQRLSMRRDAEMAPME
jgi:hypothetical protein